MVDNKSGEDYSELCRRATNYFEAKSVEIANNGGTVIIDMGMWTKIQRTELREFFKKNNIDLFFILGGIILILLTLGNLF